MAGSCPTSSCEGIAILYDYKELIKTRGVANIAQSAGDRMESFAFRVFPQDVERMDRKDGVRQGLCEKVDIQDYFERAPLERS